MTLEIDFHTHTNRSQRCGWMQPKTLVHRAEAVGLDGIAVTDHNTMDGVEPAQRAANDLLVIPGEEIDTSEGQIIGLFLSDPIDPWQSPTEVIDAIHEQGGIAFAPHPFDTLRSGLATITDHRVELDAVEALNSRCILDRYNQRARSFAENHDIPLLGGSDAHFAREVGTAYTRVENSAGSPKDEQALAAVKRAISEGRVEPEGDTGTVIVHAVTKGVKLYNRFRQK